MNVRNCMIGVVACAAAIFLAPRSYGQTPAEHKAVSGAIKAIEQCYYWVGEGDKERQKEIEHGFDRDCPIATNKAKQAYKRYPSNGELIAHIFKLMDIDYYDVDSTMKARMCEAAIDYFRRRYAKSGDQDDFFTQYCPTEAKHVYGKK